ncbi:MAG: hypothetical protein AB7O60_08240 [Variibacter sp.]
MSQPSARAIRSHNTAVKHLARSCEERGLSRDLAFTVAADACHAVTVAIDRALKPLVVTVIRK